MTTRNLDALFEPRSIALIGASNHEGTVGAVLARNLLETGFQGPVMAVNPHADSIRSTLAYPSIAALPVVPDLAVIATPAAGVPDLIAELGARGCRAAVVISAGFDAAEHGLRQRLLEAARPHMLRIVGPNCLGFISPARGINASFAQLTPAAGGLALVSQSGAIVTAALDWAAPRGIGFSHVVSLGDQADVDFGDMLDYLALDPQTQAILLYVESIHDARKFMTAGRIAARSKPVVVIKTGRGAAGARAAFSHTGALAGSDAVYDAAFRRAGMLRVTGLRELFDAVSTLTAGLRIEGERLAILTNGGGAGVMAADALEAAGGTLAVISEAGRKRLAAVLPPTAGLGNPIDIIGDAQPDRYRAALEVLLQEPEADAVLVMNCPTAVADSTAAARAVVETMAGCSKPVLSCWLGDPSAREGRRVLAAAGIPAHETPEEAVLAFQHLAAHRASQRQLLRAPSAGEPRADKAAARTLVEAAMAAGRDRLTDPEARALLAAYAIPVIESQEVATAKAAGEAAEAFGGPIALKILSPDISHKSDIGGVMLGLTGAVVVEAAATQMLRTVQAQKPEANLEGFIVEAMAVRPRAEELIVGLTQDAVFGPVVLFGRGGIAVELEADRAVGLAPLDEVLADDLIGRTRVAKRLAGYRDRPPADRAALGRALTAISQLAIDLPEVAELDINPLLADADGVLALDARVRLAKPGPASRPAIGPYPEGLDRRIVVQETPLTVRPIRPQDAPRLTEMVSKSSAEDVRLRFRTGLHALPDSWAERLAHIDYDREMALVAELADGAIAGVARLAADPEALRAEFALMVRSDWSGRGLGGQLLQALLDYAAARGLKEIWGDTDRDNARMLGLADAAGFTRAPSDDPARARMIRSFP